MNEITIRSAEEFVNLRASSTKADQYAASRCCATEGVWLDVIRRFPEMKKWVAHNKSIQPSIISLLSVDADPTVRLFIAMKRKCPPEVLQRLASDQDESVRNAVALNPHTPTTVLAVLANDEWDVCAKNASARLAAQP
jgi:hypothetical protein